MTTEEAISPTSATTTSPPRPRLFFADNLRIWLTVLVVLHHFAITYAVVSPWYYVEYKGAGLTQLLGLVFVLANQAYFMGFFFLISGFFTPASFDKKGAGGFVRGRLLRLGVPLLMFLVAIGPLAGLGGRFSTLPPEWKPPADQGVASDLLGLLNPGPLWFVEVLLLLAVAYAVWRLVTARRTPTIDATPKPPRYTTVGLFVLALACTTWALRIAVPIGAAVPMLGWPTPAYLPQYVSFFFVGVLAYRRGWFTAITTRMGVVGLVAALAMSAVALPVALLGGGDFGGGATVHAFAYALWDSTSAVGLCLFLITLFRQRFNTQGRLARFGSSHAFAVYVLHAAVITWLAVAVRDVQLPAAAKFALFAPPAIAACFGVAYLVRKIPGVKKVL